jgi:hypothetical protein
MSQGFCLGEWTTNFPFMLLLFFLHLEPGVILTQSIRLPTVWNGSNCVLQVVHSLLYPHHPLWPFRRQDRPHPGGVLRIVPPVSSHGFSTRPRPGLDLHV